MNKLYDTIKKKEFNGLDVSPDEIDTFLLYDNLKLQREVLEELIENNRNQYVISKHLNIIKVILIFFAVLTFFGFLVRLNI